MFAPYYNIKPEIFVTLLIISCGGMNQSRNIHTNCRIYIFHIQINVTRKMQFCFGIMCNKYLYFINWTHFGYWIILKILEL